MEDLNNDAGEPEVVEQETGDAKERTFTQSELDAIIERRIAKERDRLSKNHVDEEAVKKAAEEGYARGQFAARRQQVADQYAISAELLPDTEEKLAEFEKQLNTTITNKRRVLPVEVKPTTAAPSWMGAVHV